jgi:ribosome-binding factor A
MSQRAEQVAEELRKVISRILLHELGDPDLGFITVTRIQVTDDLRFARVYYSALGDAKRKEEAREVLARHLPRIRHLAVERINLKFAMSIRFEEDDSIDHSFRIDSILRRIHGEPGPEAPPSK